MMLADRHIQINFRFLILFSIIGLLSANAQNSANSEDDEQSVQKQFAFKTLTINDGLSQNSVISIAQDSIGYLWLATQDGLNKYDGRQFIHYNKQFEDITRATYSKLGKVYIDKQNRLWIITHSGKLELYQNKTDSFKHIPFEHPISSIFQDKQFNLYLGTYDSGLFKIDHTKKDTIKVFTDRTVYDYLETKEGLFLSASGGVYKCLNDNTCKKLEIKDIAQPNFSCLAKTSDGTIWLGTYGDGLFYKPSTTNTFTKFDNKDLPKTLNVEDILVDKKGRLWIATYGNGVYLLNFKTKRVNNFKANKSNPFAIHYNDMLCLFEDTTGVIWFGSDGTGASYYDEHLIKFNILTNNQVPKEVNVDMVRSIASDDEGNIWIGTSGKGLTHFDTKNETYKTYTINNSRLASNRIISLNYQNNELWIGHQGYGLDIREKNGNYSNYPDLKDYTIWKILEETPTKSWLCTETSGILLFDKNKGILKAYNQSNSGLTSNNIRTIIKENDSILWIGTDNDGIFKFNKDIGIITKLKAVNDKIKSLCIYNDILWIGTLGSGLKAYHLTNKTIKTYNVSDGLPNDVVYGILPDNKGTFWLSTNNGISRFNPSDVDNMFENFSVYDGLQGSEFNTGAYYKDVKGTLYFGGLEGINWFHPNQLTYNTIKPKTIISKLEIFSKEQPIIQNKELAHNDNTVTFTFSSLHFSQPERNLYKYKLENHDTDWIESGNKNSAHYTNLPPNNYTFKVMSCSYDGVWNETPAIYNFKINQPWYLSTNAIVVYILLFLALCYFIYYYLKWRWHMKMQLQFEHEETKRLKKLNKFKTRLYTNLSHEFRTPLTLINGPLEKQLNNPDISKSAKQDLSLVQRNSKRLLNLVDQLLDLSKLETGHLSLSVSQDDLTSLLKQLIQGFQFKAKEKKINFSYEIATMKEAWFDGEVIEKIVTNLLSNAIKYTPKGGKIHFVSSIHEGQVIITTINNGNTLTDKQIGKLFQRYYQRDKNSDGVGIGLSLVKELCILSHGNIMAHAMNNDEIQFTVTLPIERSFFSATEVNENDVKLKSEYDESILNPSNITKSENLKDKPILLIVEDDDDIRTFISSIFESEYALLASSNGKEGIKTALKTIPDIVISDVMMPKKNGIELCNTLKADERTSHIPIILLTAKSGDKNEIKGLKTGADDYITKPFNSEKLKIRVANLLEQRRQLQKKYSSSFELNQITIDGPDEKFLKKLKDVLNEHISNPEFNAQHLSEKMYMSRMQLHRKLKALTGLSTTEFIRLERLNLAKNLLLQNNSTIAEIAYSVGFNTPSYFIKCFKETFKYTPSEYQSK